MAATVHLVAKTHLDVGFTDRAAAVVDTYVERYIPAAIALCAQMRRLDGAERFVWTTGSWLVHTYLERADRAGRAAAEGAIAAGDLAWHALPFTTHTELCDPALVEAGLGIAARLDQRFGRRTIAAKLTDVPGHTRALVGLLAGAGVELLHVGVNPAWRIPEVPGAFRWRGPGGDEVTVVYQAGGYGGVASVPGADDVLAFANTGDNLGPPTADAVVADHAAVAARAPGAEVRASTLDAFAGAIRPVVPELPVVTAEIGDRWIHGVGSDPRKVAALRELLRLRRSWLVDGRVGPDDQRLRGFHENLLLVCEHTWGLDEKEHLPDRTRWAPSDLPSLRSEAGTRAYEASWAEQRAYVDAAVAALAGTRLQDEAATALAGLVAPSTDRPWRTVGWTGRVLGGWELDVDPRTGAVSRLCHVASGRLVASEHHPILATAHRSYSEADYARFVAHALEVAPEDEWWATEDNTKPGIDAAGAVAAWWVPERVEMLGVEGALVIRLHLPAESRRLSGAPRLIEVELTDASPVGDEGGVLRAEVRWDAKPANRLPEATWVSFRPVVDDPAWWMFDKLGEDVSPLDVVCRGARHLHAVGDGGAHNGDLRLRSLDAPLVAPGRPALLPVDDELPDLAGGLHVCLHDNLWGTNFPMWSEGPARFRFELSLGEGSDSGESGRGQPTGGRER